MVCRETNLWKCRMDAETTIGPTVVERLSSPPYQETSRSNMQRQGSKKEKQFIWTEAAGQERLRLRHCDFACFVHHAVAAHFELDCAWPGGFDPSQDRPIH